MTAPHDEQDAHRGTAPGVADPGQPPRRRPGLRQTTVAAAVVLALAAAAVAALRDGSGGGNGPAATMTPSATAASVTPPAAQVRPVHEALHDIDARCRAKGEGGKQTSLTRDIDTIIDFSRRYPDARFPIDDETGSTLSLLLVARQSMRDCAPALAARVDRALPSDFRDGAPTAS
ncbi:hypothetical protein ACF09G_03885 [Streptomyces albogriseolus]|uniref:Uncharacterized protein n=2 Tax=unclassified Streptomyces TaxID=2593676 RepID=V9Z1H3_9ACTN|nr:MULTISPECIES: hypothetical protein [unclassified Streptomyces]AHE38911.1 hypothetical protein pFRL3_134c [Streptomyces sp. FR1]AHE39395.1 hypothetical protein pFRL4_162c [Streptomyces sp. F2]